MFTSEIAALITTALELRKPRTRTFARCASFTAEGVRCFRVRAAGSRYCWQHR